MSATVGLRLMPRKKWRAKKKPIAAKIICTDRKQSVRKREAERTAREEVKRAERAGLPIIGKLQGKYGVEHPVVGLKSRKHFTRALDVFTLVRVLFDTEDWTGG